MIYMVALYSFGVGVTARALQTIARGVPGAGWVGVPIGRARLLLALVIASLAWPIVWPLLWLEFRRESRHG